MKKIEVNIPVVVISGDEMSRIALQKIREVLVEPYVSYKAEEYDWGVTNRFWSGEAALKAPIEQIQRNAQAHGIGVAVKDATVTPSKSQNEDLAVWANAKASQNGRSDKPATGSPNGLIRAAFDANIVRSAIPVGVPISLPNWKQCDLEVVTVNQGRSHQEHVTKAETAYDFKAGEHQVKRTLPTGSSVSFTSLDLNALREATRAVFERALKENKDLLIGAKDTVIKGYDGQIKAVMEEVFAKEFKDKFAARDSKKFATSFGQMYGLIDAQAALVVKKAPQNTIWFVPDQPVGLEMKAMVDALKSKGLPADISARIEACAFARMTSGGKGYGEGHYGSINNKVSDAAQIAFEGKNFSLKANDPFIFMSCEPSQTKGWAEQIAKTAKQGGQNRIVFALDQNSAYQANVASHVKNALAGSGIKIEFKTPSESLAELTTAPAKGTLYASLNLDGDIVTDIAAELAGTLGTGQSVIQGAYSGKDVYMFEAPHGTAHDLFYNYLQGIARILAALPADQQKSFGLEADAKKYAPKIAQASGDKWQQNQAAEKALNEVDLQNFMLAAWEKIEQTCLENPKAAEQLSAWIKSGKHAMPERSFNPTALIYAYANSFALIADISKNQQLATYAAALKKAVAGVFQGGARFTGDFIPKLTAEQKAGKTPLNLDQFLAEANLQLAGNLKVEPARAMPLKKAAG